MEDTQISENTHLVYMNNIGRHDAVVEYKVFIFI